MPSPVLVDSSVILDIVTEDREWVGWSAEALERAGEGSRLVINPLIYAEVSIGFDRIEDLDDALPAAYLQREPLPWEAGFLAGKVFLKYRRSGGTRRTPLPDFYIGAHAAIRGYTLLTRDPRRFRSYFPRLRLITP
ncbi:MAG: type II toxin-antitoxin system VapC family toxin [Gemmatimonadota bacterium]